MVKSTSGQLLTKQSLLEPHSVLQTTLPADGCDFFASSSSSSSSSSVDSTSVTSTSTTSLNQEKKSLVPEAFISYSFPYEDGSFVWSNAAQLSLEQGKSLFTLDKADQLLIPVYNATSRVNESFVPVRVVRQEEDGVAVLVVTPYAVVKNKLSVPVWISVGTSEQVCNKERIVITLLLMDGWMEGRNNRLLLEKMKTLMNRKLTLILRMHCVFRDSP